MIPKPSTMYNKSETINKGINSVSPSSNALIKNKSKPKRIIKTPVIRISNDIFKPPLTLLLLQL